MEEPKEVSENVKAAAKSYAIRHFNPFKDDYQGLYLAYIAGAAFMKPIEHNAKPEDTNGKENA